MTKDTGGKVKGAWHQGLGRTFLFLGVVVGLYLFFLVVEPLKVADAFIFGIKVLAKLWPVLLFVFCLMFVVNLLVKLSWVRRHVGHGSGLKGVLLAQVGGIISMGPVYIWYAMLSDFQKKGMRPALIAVFLYSRGIKIPLLPLMTFYMALFAVLTGLATEWLAGHQLDT